jgi:two-component SAPR family response regulator
MLKLAGVLYKEFNNTDESITYLKSVIDIEPLNSEALMMLGKIYDKISKH